MRALLLLLAGLVPGCDPVWGVTVRAKSPSALPVEDATLAVACSDGNNQGLSVRTRPDGSAHVGAMGGVWPVGCDIYLAKPGFRTHRIRYRDLCPQGPEGCDRVFAFDLVLEPERR